MYRANEQLPMSIISRDMLYPACCGHLGCHFGIFVNMEGNVTESQRVGSAGGGETPRYSKNVLFLE